MISNKINNNSWNNNRFGMSLNQLHRVDSNGTVIGLNGQFNLQLIPKQEDGSAVNSDLTGNTMTTENQNYIQQIPSTTNNNGVNYFEDLLSWQAQPGNKGENRRLSISDYNVDNAGYYEYEYFGKQHDDLMMQFNDNNDQVMMMSDEEDMGELELEFGEPQRKKVKDYFKLNIFSSNSGGSSLWGRKKKNAAEETEAVINPSQLLFHDTFHDDEEEEEEEGEAIRQFTVFDTQTLDYHRPIVSPPVAAPAAAVVKRRSGSMPKTRGRKPSPIPDASKQFACEFCDRRFKRQEHLKRHVRSLHMCEKPFQCHICDKKFSRSDNLNQHIKTHSHQ